MLLRCHLPWSPLPHVMFTRSGTLLIAENRSTFWSLRSVLGDHGPGPVAAVGWGEGRHLPALLRSVVELPMQVQRICYFGDVDGDSLAIAVAAAERASELELPPLEPARSLYELLAMHARLAADTTKLRIGEGHLAWLPDTVRGWAAELASNRQRAAQEAVGRQVLTSNLGWVDRL